MGETAQSCGFCGLIEQIRADKFDQFIAELPHGYVILGDQQFYRGYCIVFAKTHVTELFLMPLVESRALYDEMVMTAKAIAQVVKPWKMNYECLGNTVPHVHWHLFPRDESDALRHGPIWVRAESERRVALPDADRRALTESIRAELKRLGAIA